jgi:osmoprotectant transport system substrate-binding protein
MNTARKRIVAVAAAVAAAALALAGCSSGNPLANSPAPSSSGGSSTIVVGSQAYASNEVVAEVYAQALEGKGFTVKRQFNIGQRPAYMPSIQSGAIQLFPEYTGNLLQYFDKTATATSTQDVYNALKKALPSNLEVLNMATATDQDSYTVTKAFADKWGLHSIADLSKVTVPLVLGGNPELASRPYGPTGLKSVYGIDLGANGFKATGETTEQALVAGTVNIADIYTSDPKIKTDDLVVLKDPKGLILASNIVPLVNKDVASKLAGVINPVSAKLTPAALVDMNLQNTVDQKSAAEIAKAWLAANHLK